ncbi:hypothetical protein Pyn_17594 [Prunus yedoensis var. nudiflora]|uniref:Uncharacterized protein n=1 Tax=Prunus yedoensis var. nudiflora TaxID=2094558 RepID=A0A314YQ00_PRUYE|nr:hypothetical protein Pyn_17594 [Prunus yedoensis var. nudiflora]
MGAWDVGNLELVFGFGDDAWDVDATSPPLSLCSMNKLCLRQQSSLRKIPLRQSSLSSSALSASASLIVATSLSRRHLSQSPPPLSVAAITDSAQQFAAISSFYLPLFLSVRFAKIRHALVEIRGNLFKFSLGTRWLLRKIALLFLYVAENRIHNFTMTYRGSAIGNIRMQTES